ATASARASALKHRARRQQAAAQPSASAMGQATEMRSSGPGARVSARPAAERAPLAQAPVRPPEVRFSVFAMEPAKETESSGLSSQLSAQPAAARVLSPVPAASPARASVPHRPSERCSAARSVLEPPADQREPAGEAFENGSSDLAD